MQLTDKTIYYHRGHLSIPSIHNQYNPANEHVINIKVIRPLCDSLEYMSVAEEMDLYMASAGWRPALDTLNKIAAWNSCRDILSTTLLK